MSYQYKTLSIAKTNKVLTATMSSPPMNVMGIELYQDLMAFTEQVSHDDQVSVVVLQSADPDFFIAHFDVALILSFDISNQAQRSEQSNPFHDMCERLRSMPKVTIAKIAGRVGGGGSELASNCDMRFGVSGKTVINQMEVALGILPGGSGTQTLPRLMGRGRAMEVILGCDDLDAETAAQWGYLNRALAADQIDTHVDALAQRIASFPINAISKAKQSVLNAEQPLAQGLREEEFLFQQTLRDAQAQKNMQRFLQQGGQTREQELKISQLALSINQDN